VYQQAFSEIISGGAKPDQAVDKAFKADRGDLRQIPDRERLTLRRFAACQPKVILNSRRGPSEAGTMTKFFIG
jgi:hypothetical protein